MSCVFNALGPFTEDHTIDLDIREALEPTWFRVEARHYVSTDEYGDIVGGSSNLQLIEYRVIRHTPRGAWLDNAGSSKFVLRDMQHRARAFAAPTIEQAKADFKLRKQYRIKKLEAQIHRAKVEISLLGSHTTLDRIKG